MRDGMYLLCAFAFFVLLELVQLGASQWIGCTGAKRVLGGLCRAVLAVCGGAFLLAAGLFGVAGWGILQDGNVGQGLLALLCGVLLAVCVYFWLLRGWWRAVRQNRAAQKHNVPGCAGPEETI